LPKRGADPPSTIIRRVYFALRVRALLYGRDVRPFGRALRRSWTTLLAHYTRSRALRYGEALAVAEAFARELRCGPPLHPSPETDDGLRAELSRRLAAAAKRKATTAPAPRASRDEVVTFRIAALVRS
jgi:hypothetical protein